MSRFALLAAMALTLVQTPALAAEPPAAEIIVSKADAVRNPADPFERKLRLIEYVDGAIRNETTLRVYSKVDSQTGQFRNLVRYEEPPRDAAKAVLMNGTMMWFYDPASRTSVRISPQQRLLGQAAQGDVVTVNLAHDYKPRLVGPPDGETLTDAGQHPRRCWHVELTPANDSAIYGKADYWVEQETYRPIKGKFYSDSGRLLKIAYYHKYEERLGAVRPTEIILIDAVDSKLVTTMNASDDKPREIPDSWYQRDFLPRIGQ
jgi:outer membrane lipoprotein-sorting protein